MSEDPGKYELKDLTEEQGREVCNEIMRLMGTLIDRNVNNESLIQLVGAIVHASTNKVGSPMIMEAKDGGWPIVIACFVQRRNSVTFEQVSNEEAH